MNEFPPPAAGPTESAPPPSAVAVIASVFYAPVQAFEALRARPRWWLALAILVLTSLAVQLAVLRHLDMAGTVRERMEAAARGRAVSEADVERAVEQGQKFAPVGAVAGALAAPVVFLLLGGVYFLGLKLAGSQAEFKPVFATTLHATLPPAVVSSALTAVVVAQKGTMTANEMGRAVKSNLGAFLSPQAPAALRSAAEVLDVFNLWTWVLLAIGLSITGGIPRARAATVVAVVWVGWVGLRALLASLF